MMALAPVRTTRRAKPRTKASRRVATPARCSAVPSRAAMHRAVHLSRRAMAASAGVKFALSFDAAVDMDFKLNRHMSAVELPQGFQIAPEAR